MTYTTKQQAISLIESRGYSFSKEARSWVNGQAYAWITEEWSPKHQKMRFRAHTAGWVR